MCLAVYRIYDQSDLSSYIVYRLYDWEGVVCLSDLTSYTDCMVGRGLCVSVILQAIPIVWLGRGLCVSMILQAIPIVWLGGELCVSVIFNLSRYEPILSKIDVEIFSFFVTIARVPFV